MLLPLFFWCKSGDISFNVLVVDVCQSAGLKVLHLTHSQ